MTTRWNRSGAGYLVVLLLVTACGERDGVGGAADTLVRDSAGIRIVESVAPSWAAREKWRISDTPLLTIGLMDGPPEYQLHQIRSAVRLADGRIAMTDGRTSELRIYGPDGRHLVSAGGSGGGPGEFRYIGDLLPIGDSIGVWDPIAMRLTVFGTDGGIGRSLNLGEGPEGAILAGSSRVGTLTFGQAVYPTAPAPTSPSAGIRPGPEIVYTRHTADGAPIDTVVRIRAADSVHPLPGRLASASFAPVPRLVARGDRIVSGGGERYELEFRAADGRLLTIARIPHTPERVTEEHLAVVDRRRRAEAPPDYAARLPALRAADFAEYFPAYGDFHIDAAGHVWVMEYPRPSQDVGALAVNVFDPDGIWLATLSVPGGLVVHDVGDDYLLGMWRDELDVEYLQLYEVSRE
jgi:hypothetical protein